MPNPKVVYSVFTKFWNLPIAELAQVLVRAGVNGAEMPVRPGYPVDPANAARALPEAARIFADAGLKIFSIAPPEGPIDERLVAACAAAGVPLMRVMVKVGPAGYLACEAAACREYERLLPVLARHGVKIGVQNHYGNFVATAAGLRRIVEKFHPRQVGAVYDVGHCCLNGEIPELAIDLLWSHLAMLNLKNMTWERIPGTDPAGAVRWRKRVIAGREGLAPWPDAVAGLRRRGWEGIATICAEFDDLAAKERLLLEDVAFAKELFKAPLPA